MRIAVIGAGVVGVCTAWELSIDGHEVEVFDQRNAVASECSFANAGLIAPGYVTPWAAPGMPGKILRHLFNAHAPVRLNATLNPAVWSWCWRWLMACRREVHERNRSAMHHLAKFSQQRLAVVVDKLKLDYERSQGCLVLMRDDALLEQAQAGLALLRTLGVKYEQLDAAGCRRIEPSLRAEEPLGGGIHLPGDEVGNCRQFTQLLRDDAEKHGAEFQLANEVQRIRPGERLQIEVRHDFFLVPDVVASRDDRHFCPQQIRANLRSDSSPVCRVFAIHDYEIYPSLLLPSRHDVYDGLAARFPHDVP